MIKRNFLDTWLYLLVCLFLSGGLMCQILLLSRTASSIAVLFQILGIGIVSLFTGLCWRQFVDSISQWTGPERDPERRTE